MDMLHVNDAWNRISLEIWMSNDYFREILVLIRPETVMNKHFEYLHFLQRRET